VSASTSSASQTLDSKQRQYNRIISPPSRTSSVEINRYLDNIAKRMIAKHQEDEAHEALLKKHGFEPMSKEEMFNR
jgi:hypothetical protein